jgi:hypothetical protein
MKRRILIALGIVALDCSLRAQGTFQNLDFEAARLSPIPESQYGSTVPIAEALPGWTGALGPMQVNSVLQNNLTAGGANIAIFGPDWTTTRGIIEGRWTVLLQAGGLNSSLVDAALSQMGVVPSGTLSVLVKVSGTDFSLSFAGRPIALVPLFSDSNYTLFGGDISGGAGQLGQLVIAAQSVSNHPFNNVFFDSIVFSTQPIPEPGFGALVLAGLALSVWAAKLRARKRPRWS